MVSNGREQEVEEMTTAEVNAYLERIAEILEMSGHHEAAVIVRSKKI